MQDRTWDTSAQIKKNRGVTSTLHPTERRNMFLQRKLDSMDDTLVHGNSPNQEEEIRSM